MSQTVDKDAGAHVGNEVTLEGTALEAHAGAVVMLADGNPVYVTGLEEWDAAFFRQTVRVTGKLRRKKLGPNPSTNDKGEHSHGIQGTDVVIDDATWALA